MMYLPGIAFLFLASAVIAIPFAVHVRNKSLAIFLPVCLSALILKTWAYLVIGGFDLGFLMIQIIIGFCAAVIVNFVVDRIQKRIHV
ncbi:MAG: hypothetical protein ACXW4M_15460 [Anaerolineales bacterium]